MGCGCKIAEGSPVGAWVDHSDCRIADLTASLAEANAVIEREQKAWIDVARTFTANELFEVRRQLEQITAERDALTAKVSSLEQRNAVLVDAVRAAIEQVIARIQWLQIAPHQTRCPNANVIELTNSCHCGLNDKRHEADLVLAQLKAALSWKE